MEFSRNFMLRHRPDVYNPALQSVMDSAFQGHKYTTNTFQSHKNAHDVHTPQSTLIHGGFIGNTHSIYNTSPSLSNTQHQSFIKGYQPTLDKSTYTNPPQREKYGLERRKPSLYFDPDAYDCGGYTIGKRPIPDNPEMPQAHILYHYV